MPLRASSRICAYSASAASTWARLGSKDLYRWLRELPPEQVRGIGMTRVSHINELYGGSEALEREQANVFYVKA